MNTTVGEIAALVGGTVLGDASVRITGLNGIREAMPGELTFLADSRYLRHLETTQAAAVLGSRELRDASIPIIQVDDPRQGILRVLLRIQQDLERAPEPGMHAAALIHPCVTLGKGVVAGPHVVVEEGAVLGDGVVLHAGAYVGRDATIGPGTVLHANVTVCSRVTIGARCVINHGAVIGSDGFGFARHGNVQIKIPQVGTVILGDDVEVGANSAIDRATFGATVVGDGSKIDNLVQIGHNVRIGKNCIVCGNAGIAGSTVLGENVTIGAGAGLTGHIEIGDGASVAAYSGVTKSVPPGCTVFGYPAVELERGRRMQGSLRQLPDALRRIKALEARCAQLEGQLHGTPEDDS
ncbi:MAG: UDP-3-O-(3-hydroxymyristoyl)glucosamine N-acyltransferase [Candidatus Hydrogenedentes bacterium]|nr:UDP-3-O-(3-hydroxymyristoyl)glucosamine N-acyltransferase [Candidatus Hydrogenedentota bacterium]